MGGLGRPPCEAMKAAMRGTLSLHPVLRFDRVTRDGLARILGVALDERAWQQAKLPVAMGGMGMRGAEDHAPVAYAASVLASQPLAQALQVGVQALQGEGEELTSVLSAHLLVAMSATMGEEVVEAELVGVTQRLLGVKVDKEQKKRLMAGVEEVEVKARLPSLALPHAGDWLNMAPILALGLHLKPLEFCLAVNQLRDVLHQVAAAAQLGPR